MVLLIVVLSASLVDLVKGVELDEDNYEELTTGKIVFFKYYDPMWGHCIKMEDDWEKLEEVYENSKSKLIGSIDCTAKESRSLCVDEGISGFPTLKFGTIYDLQEYGGPRDYSTLKKFADKNLKQICGPNNLQLCDKVTRREIRRLQKLSLKELDTEIFYKTEDYNAIEKRTKKAVEVLEEQYKQAEKTKKEDKKRIQETGGDLELMKAVLALRKQQAAP